MNRRYNHEIVDHRQVKKNKFVFAIYVLAWIVVLMGVYQLFQVDIFILGSLLFFSVISFNWLPIKRAQRIRIEMSSFIVTNGKTSLEVDFTEIAYIDQNVVDGSQPYYESITFLDSNFKELIKLEANGFDYKELVVLCESIQQSNYEFGASALEMNSLNKLWNDENTFDI